MKHQDLRPALSSSVSAMPHASLALGNPEWEAAGRRVLILRLSRADDVSRSSSHAFLARECREAMPDAFVDFAFLPDHPDRLLFDKHSLSWFPGVVSARAWTDFDLVMISNSFALELVNLPHVFRTAGVPYLSSERAKARDENGAVCPIVILGGSNAMAAGSIVREDGDSLVDGIFAGEGEDSAGKLALILSDRAAPPSSRLSVAASSVPGFARLGAGTPPQSRSARAASIIGTIPARAERPVLNTAESSTVRLEISRGCPALCSFCFEGWDRKPYRELHFGEIIGEAARIRDETGASTLELYSFNFNTHERVIALLEGLNRIFPRVNAMSQRPDILATVPGLLAAEVAAGKASFTLGIEGVSAKMRAYLRKSLPEETLDTLLKRLFACKLREMKFFYILTGVEKDKDLVEFCAFLDLVKDLRATGATKPRVLFSFGRLVRMPGTPLAFGPLSFDANSWHGLTESYKGAVETRGFEFRMGQHFDEFCADQLLVLADGRLIPGLVSACEAGAIYADSLSKGAWGALERGAREAGLLSEAFMAEKDRSWAFPPAFAEGRVDADTLYGFYLEARSKKDDGYCLGTDCKGCGACDDVERDAILGHGIEGDPKGVFERSIARILAAKQKPESLWFPFEVPGALYGAGPEYLSAWISALWLSRFSDLPESSEIRALARQTGFREALFLHDGDRALRLPAFHGGGLFALEAPAGALAMEEFSGRAFGFTGTARWDSAPVPRAVLVELRLPAGAPVRGAVDAFLLERHIAHTSGTRDGNRYWTIAPKDMKKGIVEGVEYRERPDTTRPGAAELRIHAGHKADLRGLLDALGLWKTPMAGDIRTAPSFDLPVSPGR